MGAGEQGRGAGMARGVSPGPHCLRSGELPAGAAPTQEPRPPLGMAEQVAPERPSRGMGLPR